MKRYILTTGPMLLHKVPLTEIHNPKYIYRINGAHGDVETIDRTISEIRAQIPDADILLDLPGNKIRTRNLPNGGIQLEVGKECEIPSRCFNYPEFYQRLKPGMNVLANDSIFQLEVVSSNPEKIVFRSYSEGILIDNKGMHVRGIHDGLPFLFEKDMRLVELCNRRRLAFAGLSFVRTAENVALARSLLSPETEVFAKVETLDAVNHLNDILAITNYILVDRGDLSTDIGLEKIPRYQKYIIERALFYDVKVFLATQILKNMETRPVPTIGEIEALYEIYKSGVYGIQMSEETAMGNYIKECLNVMETMENEIRSEHIVL